jgi:hypothetical protein
MDSRIGPVSSAATRPFPIPGRRDFLRAAGLVALGGIAGCRTPSQAKAVPAGGWPEVPSPPGEPASVAAPVERASPLGPVLPRESWTREVPDFALMDPMVPVHHLTIHHDGLDALFETDDLAATAARIELYRRGHRGRGWADIGYHFAIDRAGRVWAARPIDWQGAHVKDRNPGNVGILVMGNFEIQRPTEAQLVALDRHLAAARAYWNVPWSQVVSHREWPGATTLCPGRNLQERFTAMRGEVVVVA